jgi:murein DD-endopeptidase MepM/ murein hydrolase activator NlpD
MYFHLEDSTVKAGDYVEKGTLIGRVGSSGRATGPHLHLGVRIVNERVNPMDLFR